MGLFSSLGTGSSPLFINSELSAGIDSSPLKYYVDKKEDAKDALAKKLAADTPTIPKFDVDGLPGNAQALENKYNTAVNNVSEGVKKYGGLWTIYTNTDEGKSALGKVATTVYDANMAKQNKKQYEAQAEFVDKNNLGGLIYIDRSTGAPLRDKTGFAKNATYLDYQTGSNEWDENGNIAKKDLTILEGDSGTVNAEFKNYMTQLGTTENMSESEKQAKLTGGAYDYDGLIKNKNSKKNNFSQLLSMSRNLYSNMSQSSKTGMLREVYDIGEKEGAAGIENVLNDGLAEKDKIKIDMDRLSSNDPKDISYRNGVMALYTMKRVDNAVPSYIQSEEGHSQTMTQGTKIANEKAANVEADKRGYIAQVQAGNIIPKQLDDRNVKYYNPTTKLWETRKVSGGVQYSGLAAVQGLADINKDIIGKTLESLGIDAIRFGDSGTVNNLSTSSNLKNATIVSANRIVTDDALVYDPTNHTYRAPTSQEKDHAQEVISNAVPDPNDPLVMLYQRGNNAGQPLTDEDLKTYQGSQANYMEYTIDLGPSGEAGLDLHHNDFVDNTDSPKTVDATDNYYLGPLSINDVNSTLTYEQKGADGKTHYYTKISAPMQPSDVATGNENANLYAGYGSMKSIYDKDAEQQAAQTKAREKILSSPFFQIDN